MTLYHRVNEERREGKHVKVETRTSEVIIIKVGSHDVPIPSVDEVGESSSNKSEAGTNSSQTAGLTSPSGRSDSGPTAGLTDDTMPARLGLQAGLTASRKPVWPGPLVSLTSGFHSV